MLAPVLPLKIHSGQCRLSTDNGSTHLGIRVCIVSGPVYDTDRDGVQERMESYYARVEWGLAVLSAQRARFE